MNKNEVSMHDNSIFIDKNDVFLHENGKACPEHFLGKLGCALIHAYNSHPL